MPRNTEKDTREEARRRKQILDAGFRLFAEHGIETVSMNTVAEAAGVGPTTLFKYYQTKEKLVVAISGMAWSAVWQADYEQIGLEQFSRLSAFEMIRHYTDHMIRLYQQQPALLRFSGNYKTFINRQKTKTEDLKEHLDPLSSIRSVFHMAYLRARTDHSIRTDVPEDVLFTTIAIGMLSMAERYAQGIVWAGRGEEDHTRELRIVQEMILSWCVSDHHPST
ncbi:MAG: TetR/AcrR family transcriptional regulator [Clostridia bacterium]|nr:TetR/AcrR family transcriptional regulator [Clostridia bacterium]